MIVYPDLKIGSVSPEVGNLQRFLNRMGARDHEGRPLVDDENFGPRTSAALKVFQSSQGVPMPVTGIFDGPTRRVAWPLGFVPFLATKNQTTLWPKRRTPNLIVIHTAECIESNGEAAENLALWIAGKTSYVAPNASWHYAVDKNSVVQSVRDTDVAWHASQANTLSIGIEQAGFARQSATEWNDPDSQAILFRSSRLVAALCVRWQIPIRQLSPAQVKAGASGICGHVDVNAAYGNRNGHTDPGPFFPWATYLSLCAEHAD